MEFICSKTRLLEAFNNSDKLLNKDDKKVNILAYNNALVIQAQTEEHLIETEIWCDVKKEGEISVDADKLPKALKKIKSELVVFKRENSTLSITCGDFNIKYKTDNIYNLKKTTELEKEFLCYIDSNIFLNMLRKVKKSISIDTTKDTLRGAYFEVYDKNMKITTIDGYRMTTVDIGVKGAINNNNFIINKIVIDLLIKILPKNSLVTISKQDSYIIFKYDNVEIKTKPIEGEFVDYRNILPKEECNTRIKLNRLDLLEALKSISYFSNNERNNLVKLSICNNSVTLNCKTDETEIYKTINNAMTNGDNLEIAFNCKYLTESLEVLESEYIPMEFTYNVNPCIIKSDHNVSCTILILPVRVAG